MSKPARATGQSSSVADQTRSAQRKVKPFMAVAVVSVLLGMWAGLARIGWDLPAAGGDLMLRHGGLMVVGFVGTVIAVERAVAVRSLPAFAAPGLSAAAGLSLILDAPGSVPPVLATAAGAAYSLNVATLLVRHRMPPFAVALAGAVCLAVAGAVWWRGDGIARVVPWWMAFLVLTIAAERLEIIRFQRIGRVSAAGGALALGLVILGPLATRLDTEIGARLLGLGFIAGSLWLVRRDIALRTVRTDGLARFAATGVLSAYAWLAVSGLLFVIWGLEFAGLRYDATIHTFFAGFVFSAIMAHEPIIAPAVTGLRFSYSPNLYAPLVLLNAGLLMRLAADVAEASELRRWAALVQVLAILAFMAVSAASVLAGRDGDSGGRPRRQAASP